MTEQTLTLQIEGMTCEHCVAAVKNALMRVRGVTRADVDQKAGRATVTLDPQQVAVEDLVEAVEEAGYEVSPEA
ncbi:MAG: heavy-metal-associated domain-containing protein [Armatimonadetes bacterium]|nr:heavy-metal-associated domain-containing protein [Armatimonadota bacterium]